MPKAPSMRYFSERHESQGNNNVIQSVNYRTRDVEQSPMQASVKHEMSQQIVNSPLNKNSATSQEASHQKVAYKKGKKVQSPTERSVRLFKDITHSMQPQDGNANRSKKKSPYFRHNPSKDKKSPKYRNGNVQIIKMGDPRSKHPKQTTYYQNTNELEEAPQRQAEPIGYAKIDLMHDQNVESDSDGIPYDQLNTKLNRIESAVYSFYERLHDNYNH